MLKKQIFVCVVQLCSPDGRFGRPTAYCQQHGDGSEGPGEALAAHEDGAVLLGQQAHQAEQTPLQHSAERWREEGNRFTQYDSRHFGISM